MKDTWGVAVFGNGNDRKMTREKRRRKKVEESDEDEEWTPM